MAYDLKSHDTIIISTNLAASPVSGENAAVVIGKTILATLYGKAVLPKVTPPAASRESLTAATAYWVPRPSRGQHAAAPPLLGSPPPLFDYD